MNRVKYISFILLIASILLLSGCAEGGGFDVTGFVRNPVIMAIIIIVALYYAFKMRKK